MKRRRVLISLVALVLTVSSLSWPSSGITFARYAIDGTLEGVHFSADPNAGWQEVGTGSATGGGISDNSGYSRWPRMAVSSDGTPYVVWYDNSDGDYEIYVLRWNGSSWEEVGAGSASGGGISDDSALSQVASLAFAPDGTLYVAWQDGPEGIAEVYILRWNGSSWEEVGSGSASGGGISNNGGHSSQPSVAVAPDGTPYVAWWDRSGGDAEIYVRRWNGSSWEEVGTGSASGGGISNNSGHSYVPKMAFTPTGTPYVTWHDYTPGVREIYVRRWNESSWEEVGTGSASGGGISNNSGHSRDPGLAIASDGTPYITWHDNSGGDPEIYVRRWNGSSWEEVGAGSATGGGISDNDGSSEYSWIAIAPDGTPYITWHDNSSGDGEIYVRRWNGASWEEAGSGSAIGGGISDNDGGSGFACLAFAPDGTPYVAWNDDSSGDLEIYVRRWGTVISCLPDIEVSPTSFEETVHQGEIVAKTLTISNTGNCDLEFEIWETATAPGSKLTFDKTIFSSSTAKKSPEGLRLPSMPSTRVSLDIVVDEGFEGGVVPPTDWELIQTNAAQTWEIDTSSPHSGSYYASRAYDPALNPQNEVLLSPLLNLSSGNLNFWSLGSLYWCRDNNDNCDLNIWLVVGDWGGGDDVFVGKADDDWTGNWVWSESTYDLTPLLPGEPIRLGFQYEGLDGAEIAIDDIVVAGELIPDVVPWLSEEPTKGTVSASGSLPVDVIFNATGLAPGDYTANLIIHSNDPDEREPLTVPVVMHVVEETKIYLPLILKRYSMHTTADLYIQNNASANMTLCISGIACKQSPPGLGYWDSFPKGTYSWFAQAQCGTASGTDYFPPGNVVREFWCAGGRLFWDFVAP